MKLLVSSLIVSSLAFVGCVAGLGGIFSTPSTSDGVRTYRSGTTWGWEANAWKGIWGQCVQ